MNAIFKITSAGLIRYVRAANAVQACWTARRAFGVDNVSAEFVGQQAPDIGEFWYNKAVATRDYIPPRRPGAKLVISQAETAKIQTAAANAMALLGLTPA